jgi:hypothetical protein
MWVFGRHGGLPDRRLPRRCSSSVIQSGLWWLVAGVLATARLPAYYPRSSARPSCAGEGAAKTGAPPPAAHRRAICSDTTVAAAIVVTIGCSSSCSRSSTSRATPRPAAVIADRRRAGSPAPRSASAAADRAAFPPAVGLAVAVAAPFRPRPCRRRGSRRRRSPGREGRFVAVPPARRHTSSV